VSNISDIPDDVRRFVLTSIPSVAYLEAILLFMRSAQRRWSTEEVASSLYLQPRAASELLETLCAAGVVSCDSACYSYSPSAEFAQFIERVAQAYHANLVGVTNLIHSGTKKSAIQFADAFKLRKDT
jgi:hypothetical protein